MLLITTHPAAPTALDRLLDGLDGDATQPWRLTDEELTERLAECEREDRTLLRMVMAAAFATAVLGVAGGLAM
jgi:hypothetical protein